MKRLKIAAKPLALSLAVMFLAMTACGEKKTNSDGGDVLLSGETIVSESKEAQAERTEKSGGVETESSNNTEADATSGKGDDTEKESDGNDPDGGKVDVSEEIIGVWYQYGSDVSQNCEPMIAFHNDDHFLFRVNLLEGMSDVKGTYEIKPDGIYCYVTDRSFSGFAGDTITEFIFRINDDELIYEGEYMGVTMSGDAFKPYDGEIEPLDAIQNGDAD